MIAALTCHHRWGSNHSSSASTPVEVRFANNIHTLTHNSRLNHNHNHNHNTYNCRGWGITCLCGLTNITTILTGTWWDGRLWTSRRHGGTTPFSLSLRRHTIIFFVCVCVSDNSMWTYFFFFNLQTLCFTDNDNNDDNDNDNDSLFTRWSFYYYHHWNAHFIHWTRTLFDFLCFFPLFFPLPFSSVVMEDKEREGGREGKENFLKEGFKMRKWENEPSFVG